MKDLGIEYIRERRAYSIIEKPWGFIAYKIQGPECFIAEIFVERSQRKSGKAASLADQVAKLAKAADCEVLSCTVDLTTQCATESIKPILAYGFKLESAHNNVIILVKPLGE